MLRYLALLSCILLLWIVAFRQSGYELLSPVSIALLGISVSLALAVVGCFSWNDAELSGLTAGIVILGCISFILGDKIVRHFYVDKQPIASKQDSVASIKMWKYYLAAIIVLFAIGWRVIETLQLANEMGVSGNGYIEIARGVRNVLAGHVTSEYMKFGEGYSVVQRQLEKVAIAAGYVGAYLTASALVNKKGVNEFVGSAAVLCLSIIYVVISGSRSSIFFYVISLVACCWILTIKTNSNPLKMSLTAFAVCAALALAGSLIFYLMGRIEGGGFNGKIIKYISIYFGCGIPSLELMTDFGVPTVGMPGLRVFYYLFSLVYKFGLIDSFPSYSVMQVGFDGNTSNVFTAFGRYYADFGLAGVIVLSMISGILFTTVYLRAKSYDCAVWAVLFGYLTPYCFDMAREDFVFSRLISINQLIVVALIVLLTLFFTSPARVGITAKLSKKR